MGSRLKLMQSKYNQNYQRRVMLKITVLITPALIEENWLKDCHARETSEQISRTALECNILNGKRL